MKFLLLVLLLGLQFENSWAETSVNNVEIRLNGDEYQLNADVEYYFSSTANEALKKGVSLSWVVQIRLKRESFIWDEVINELNLGYQIQYHALMNLYGVKKINTEQTELFSTLTAALEEMSRVRALPISSKQVIQAGNNYFVVIRVLFNHELLPTPIRPFSYFDSDWALSSQWTSWQLND